jgi:hypothetical protein
MSPTIINCVLKVRHLPAYSIINVNKSFKKYGKNAQTVKKVCG